MRSVVILILYQRLAVKRTQQSQLLFACLSISVRNEGELTMKYWWQARSISKGRQRIAWGEGLVSYIYNDNKQLETGIMLCSRFKERPETRSNGLTSSTNRGFNHLQHSLSQFPITYHCLKPQTWQAHLNFLIFTTLPGNTQSTFLQCLLPHHKILRALTLTNQLEASTNRAPILHQ